MKNHPAIRLFVVMFFTALFVLCAANINSMPEEFYRPFYKILDAVTVP